MKDDRTPSQASIAAAEVLASRAAIRPPPGLEAEEAIVFEHLAREHASRLRTEDATSLGELARVRVHQSLLIELIAREGPTLRSRSGAIKVHPALRALDVLRRQDAAIVARLGVSRPDPATARTSAVARKREELARIMARTKEQDRDGLLA